MAFLVPFSVFATLLILLFDKNPCAAKNCSQSSENAKMSIIVRSETCVNDICGNVSASIAVNGQEYSPNQPGHNVVVFDALSGNYMSARSFATANQSTAGEELSNFLYSQPNDVIILVAIKEDGYLYHSNATNALKALGAHSPEQVSRRTSYAFIGYKGKKNINNLSWVKEKKQTESLEPSNVATQLNLTCTYIKPESVSCPFVNVAALVNGARCVGISGSANSSLGGKALDGNFATATDVNVGSWFDIEFETTFTINKVRLLQKNALNDKIKDVKLKFDECSVHKFRLSKVNGGYTFEEFAFMPRKTKSVKVLIESVFNSSGNHGIREIEFYNDYCKPATLCRRNYLNSQERSNFTRLHTRRFPFRVQGKQLVKLLLVTEPNVTAARYSIVFSTHAPYLSRSHGGSASEIVTNAIALPSAPHALNIWRTYWLDMDKDRIVLGSGEEILIFWRDKTPLLVKYLFFEAVNGTATVELCSYVDFCKADSIHHWPLDKATTSIVDLKSLKLHRIQGSFSLETASSPTYTYPLTTKLSHSVPSWINLENFRGSCVSDPSRCKNGISVSFLLKPTGGMSQQFHLSSGGQTSRGFAVYSQDSDLVVELRDGEKVWKATNKDIQANTWQSVVFSWDKDLGLEVIIKGRGAVRDKDGKLLTSPFDADTFVVIGRPNNELAKYSSASIGDLVIWEKRFSDVQMKDLQSCIVDVTPDAVYANSGYLGCSDDSKLTSINPGNYDATNMSPGVCREICSQRNYKYAQLRQGEQCLCDNKSTGYEPLDKCFMPCTGNKLARCGGENYVSVYNTPNFVQARVNLSGPEKVLIDKFFILNTTLNLPNFNTLSEYHFQVSDGTSLRTAATSFEHAFVYPGNYTVKVIATIEHNETGLVTQLTAEKNIFVEMAELNATQFRCPAIITTNLAITCSVEIQEASGVEMQMLIDQELNETFAVTDTWFNPVFTSELSTTSPNNTTRGLYLLPHLTIKEEQRIVAFQLQIKKQGVVELLVYRPTCKKSGHIYCSSFKKCLPKENCSNSHANSFTCSDGHVFAAWSCINNNTGYFIGHQVISDSDCTYTRIGSHFADVYTGSALIHFKISVKVNDVIAIRIPHEKNGAVIHTSFPGNSVFYSPRSFSASSLECDISTDPNIKVLPYKLEVKLFYHVPSIAVTRHNFTTPGLKHILVLLKSLFSSTIMRKAYVLVQDPIIGLDYSFQGDQVQATNRKFNLTFRQIAGSNITYTVDFGDGRNMSTTELYSSYSYNKTGIYSVRIAAKNKVSLVFSQCSSVIVQEDLGGFYFHRNTLTPIVNGTTKMIVWFLDRGSNVTFVYHLKPLIECKIVTGKIQNSLFIFVQNVSYTEPGKYDLQVTASNLLSNLTVQGNLTVEVPIEIVSVYYDKVAATNSTFRLLVFPHPGTNPHYQWNFSDGRSIETKHNTSYTFRRAGTYRVDFSARNKINYARVACGRIIVEDLIKGLNFTRRIPPASVNKITSMPWRLLQGTNTNVTINYGDDHENYLQVSSPERHFVVSIAKHEYLRPGTFVITLKAKNLVSSAEATTVVIAQIEVKNPAIVGFHTGGFKGAGASGQGPDSNHFPLGYPVFFNATSLGTDVMYDWDFGDGKQVNNSNCTQNHLYNSSKQFIVTVRFYNLVNEETHNISVILDLPVIISSFTNDQPIALGKNMTFDLKLKQVGNNSCFRFFLGDQDSTSLVFHWPGVNCGNHASSKFTGLQISFRYNYTNDDMYFSKVIAENFISKQIRQHRAIVTSKPCSFPKIKILGFSASLLPEITIIPRSRQIEVRTYNKIDCQASLETRFTWKLTNVSCNGGDEESPVPLTNLLTNTPGLFIPKRKLPYGCYKLNFKLNMTKVKGIVTCEKSFFKVVQSKLIAKIIGSSERVVGDGKNVTIDGSSSYDPDYGAEGEFDSKLKFYWFCKDKRSSNISFPDSKEQVLKLIRGIPKSPGKFNGGCFDKNRTLGYINETTSSFSINTTNLVAKECVFRLLIIKDNRSQSFDQTVEVQSGDPPVIAIRCKLNCERKINPSAKMTLEARCLSCKEGDNIKYEWKCGDVKDFKEKVATSLKSEILVINSNTFKISRKAYTIILEGRLGENQGRSALKRVTNAPPDAALVVTRIPGEIRNKFNLTCVGAEDEDKPLTFEFLYGTGQDQLLPLGFGTSAELSDVSLPSGKKENNYTIYIILRVADVLGAVKELEEMITVERKEVSVTQLESMVQGEMKTMLAAGNVQEAKRSMLVVADVLNTPRAETGSEERRKLRSNTINFIADVAMLTIKDVEQSSLVLSSLTQEKSEVTESSQNKSISMSEEMSAVIQQQVQEGLTSEEVKGAVRGVIGALSLAVEYVNSTTNRSQVSDAGSKTNIPLAKSSVGKIFSVIKNLANATRRGIFPGEDPTVIKSRKLALSVSKSTMKNIEEASSKLVLKELNSKFSLPNPNVLFGNASDSGVVDITSTVSSINPFLWDVSADHVTGSHVASLELTSGTNGNKLEVSNLSKPIGIWIGRMKDGEKPNATSEQASRHKLRFHKFKVDRNESAIHIYACPQNSSFRLQVFLKKSSRPSEMVHDYNKTLTSKTVDNSSESITTDLGCILTISDAELNGSAAGRYYAGIRYIANDSQDTTAQAHPESVNYTFKVFTSNCLYWDTTGDHWTNEGCQVGPLTTQNATQCLCNHLTSFGSGFFVAPNSIDPDKINLDEFRRNPIVLVTVMTIFAVYLLLLIPARRADRIDKTKTGVTPLVDNHPRDAYAYEIQVHTGFQRGSGTSAEVSVVLTGALAESDSRVLKDSARKTFYAGATDSFLMTVPQSLGNLIQVRVWHNNQGGSPSWKLLRIMVRDIQTDQRWWFVCDKWLAVDEEDGQIERFLQPASKHDLTKFNVLFTTEIRKKLTDGHIWFSVAVRPASSTFTRVQRLTCCLSILMCTMMASALWYQKEADQTPKNAIRIASFSFSLHQVFVGVMSSLVVFPANLLIVTLFRKARPRNTHVHFGKKVKEIYKEMDDIESHETPKSDKKSKGLPYWFMYVAYGSAFVCIITSSVVVNLYGLSFGKQKSSQWLSSLTVSFIQDVLISQPLKVLIMASLFALLVKDPRKVEETSYTEASALAKDEEWLNKSAKTVDDETLKSLKKLMNDRPPEQAKLEIARQLRVKEKQMHAVIREFVWYMMFLVVLLTIGYGNRDHESPHVTNYVNGLFLKATFNDSLTFSKVNDEIKWWGWLRSVVIPSAYPSAWYTNGSVFPGRFLADVPTAWRLGVARIRQLRAQRDTCSVVPPFRHLIRQCNSYYSKDLEDRGKYLPGWVPTPLLPNTSRQADVSQTKSAWEYQTGDELKTFPYWGYKATYSAGGFVQDLPPDKQQRYRMLNDLKHNGWLDRYTRAVFTELTIYNANTNLFCVVTLLFEQLATGGFLPYPSVLTLRLYRYTGGEMFFVLGCEVLYLLFSLYFVMREIKQFKQNGRQQFKNPWSVLEIFVTMLSVAAVVVYFLRLKHTADSVQEMIKNPDKFVSFHFTALLDEVFKCILGFIVFLSFLKILRLLRFNRRMSLLARTLTRCAPQLIAFMIILGAVFFSYAQFACLVFGQSMEGFGTILRSAATLMDTILGKFTLKDLAGSDRVLGPIFFYLYTISMLFVLVNMFLSIINDSFAEVKSDVSKQPNDYEIVDFMMHRLKEKIGKQVGAAIKPMYKEPRTKLEKDFDTIEETADNLVHFMRNIAFEDLRQTIWFKPENCTEKKKKLMNILMEVDWDYGENELGDSIPVFERFMEKYSDRDLEHMLKSYRLKQLCDDADSIATDSELDVSVESSENSDKEKSDKNSNNGSDSSSINGTQSNHAVHPDVEDNPHSNIEELENMPTDSKVYFASRNIAMRKNDGLSETTTTLSSVMSHRKTGRSHHKEAIKGLFGIGRLSAAKWKEVMPEGPTDKKLKRILHDVEMNKTTEFASDSEIDEFLSDAEAALSIPDLQCISEPEMTLQPKKKGKKLKKKKKKKNNVDVESSKGLPAQKQKEAWDDTEADEMKNKIRSEESLYIAESARSPAVMASGFTKAETSQRSDEELMEEYLKQKKKFAKTIKSKKKEKVLEFCDTDDEMPQKGKIGSKQCSET